MQSCCCSDCSWAAPGRHRTSEGFHNEPGNSWRIPLGVSNAGAQGRSFYGASKGFPWAAGAVSRALHPHINLSDVQSGLGVLRKRIVGSNVQLVLLENWNLASLVSRGIVIVDCCFPRKTEIL